MKGVITRQEILSQLGAASQTWDVLVIGGGATGLGTAVEAAARGYRELVISPGAWNGVQLGTAPHGFDLDAVYDDVPAGRYAVRLASGPLPGQVTITGVARERRSGLVRSVRVVYDYFPNSSLREADCSWDAAPSCP